MIKNFEKITIELTAWEMQFVGIIGEWFRQNTGKKNTLKNADIAKLIKEKTGKNIADSRVRKVVQFLRVNGLASLMATSNGYYYSNDIDEIKSWIISLKQRESAIREIREKAEKEIESMKIQPYYVKQIQMF